ncbi:hypothetical protein H4S08_002624 [Coemansia sp. RSA 1365]|nr:hypothetical protein H4S08_002624 [Coemansia sp. RSA 1365]
MPDSPHDVFALVTPTDIRRIRDNAQENFIKLMDKVFDRMLMLKGMRDLPKNPANLKQLLNCIRILTRLIPFVYEACPDGTSIEEIVLWTSRPRPGSGADYTLGKQLVSATIDLLFTSGFTIPSATVGEDAVVRYTIWENGVGQTSSLGSSKENVSNRIETLRLLLALCCKTMYVPPARSVAVPNKGLHKIAYNANKKMVLCLLCSLLNTSLKQSAQGWAIPYRNTTVLDPNNELSLYAMQALFIMLEYQTPPTRSSKNSVTPAQSAEAPDAEDDAATSTPSMVLLTGTETGAQNLFRAFVAKLHRPQEFDYLTGNIMRLLEETMRSNLSILASVTKQPTRHVMPQEATILLWLLLENNSRFREHVVDHNRSLRLFSVLLYFMLNGYNDPAQSGMVRTISHILHYLSEDSKFATRLMQPFDQSILPSNMRLVDASLTHADFMINTVFTLLRSSKPYLTPVYSNLLLLVRNVSPYLTQISQPTADKLISLFDIISSPAFIISEPYHVRWLIYLIEVFDYVVHYRAVDNPHLMYSMVKARSCFTRLKEFNLDKAKGELAALREKKSKLDLTRTIGHSASQSSDVALDTQLTTASAALPDHSRNIAQLAETSADDNHTGSPALSDKARGKRPEAGTLATQEAAEQSALAASSRASVASSKKPVAGQQFQPSPEWVFSWLPDLPLDPIIAVLDSLAIHIDRITDEVQKDAKLASAQSETVPGDDVKRDSQLPDDSQHATDTPQTSTETDGVSVDPTPAVIHWLCTDAMTKALPDLEESMPEIRPRLQGMSPALIVWFRSLLWSLIYASGMKPFGIWKNTHVRLFVVKSTH